MSAEDAKQVDAAAQAAFTSLGAKAPGLYVGVWDPKKGFFTKAYGRAEVGGTKATVDDALRIGSMTDSYTATVILQLVREGKLTLDGTVATYAPALATQFPELAPITVQQLLSMASGIPDYLQRPGGAINAIVANPQRVWTPEELIARGREAGHATAGHPRLLDDQLRRPAADRRTRDRQAARGPHQDPHHDTARAGAHRAPAAGEHRAARARLARVLEPGLRHRDGGRRRARRPAGY